MPPKSKLSNKPVSRELIEALPKTDLHLHLDGSLRLSTLIELATEAGIRLPSNSESGLKKLVFKEKYANLGEYLKGFRYTVAALQTAEALERAAFELAEDNQAEGVRYIEVRFAPQLHAGPHLSLREILLAVDRGLSQAAEVFNRSAKVVNGKEPGFRYGIIVCALRHFTADFSQNYASFFQAHEYAPESTLFSLASLELARASAQIREEEGIPIVGFDLAGREKGNPAEEHRQAYRLAHRHFLGKTVHAGEDYGPESIFQALTECYADRIGHGTFLFSEDRIRDRSIKDRKGYIQNLARYIGDRRITLEVCLTSNLQTIPEIKTLSKHPFRLMREHRLSTSICTDNRLISHTTVTNEFWRAVKTFHIDRHELRDLIIYGFKRSFFPGTYHEKRAYVRQVIDAYDAIEKRFDRRSPA